ncbi:CapA family protein [Salirhabdus salicampi]|uniref:CapA family protein n=1 Tax=Salirhabdus salicampi TaxID=476102 RepID=UPI0020C52609|nr:CapA family protein [Salirhabdus salicampi]MCP8617793.1 CapA family protein [Salirhabdus salicampi]
MKTYLAPISIVIMIGLASLFFTAPSNSKTPYYVTFNSEFEANIEKKDLPARSFIYAEKEPISIIFAGDTLFDWSVKTAIQTYGPDYPFKHIKDKVQEADLAVLNLETAVTTRGEKDTVQLYNFRSDPIALKGVKNAGFDIVSLANNHALDYQEVGFYDTIHYLEEHDLSYFGAGESKAEAYEALSIEHKGRTIKFLGFSRFLPSVHWYEAKDRPVIASAYQPDLVLQAIERESATADIVLVYMHWGVEGNNQPEQWQRVYAKNMIDAGANAIIGAHPHVLQGFEFYEGKPIAYSLGNFLFPDYVSGKTAQTGLLTLTIDKHDQLRMSFDPHVIQNNQIAPLSKEKQRDILQYLKNISYDVTMEDTNILPGR